MESCIAEGTEGRCSVSLAHLQLVSSFSQLCRDNTLASWPATTLTQIEQCFPKPNSFSSQTCSSSTVTYITRLITIEMVTVLLILITVPVVVVSRISLCTLLNPWKARCMPRGWKKTPGVGAADLFISSWLAQEPWRRQWQPTPVLLPGKSYGQRSLVGCSPWGH